MRETDRGMARKRGAKLRVAEISLTMSVAIAAGLGVGLAAMTIDELWLWPPPIDLGTVESARVLLGSITAGVLTIAVFGLWVRTIVVGMMATNFSPGTLLSFLDDRFQRLLLAFMSAGAVAVMVILLKMPNDGEAPAPLFSTVFAVLIALAALAGVLLAIQHATRSLALPEMISRLAEDALKVLDRYPEARIELTEGIPIALEPQPVRAPGTGWITSIDIDKMRQALPFRGIIHLRCRVGEFVTPRRTVALVSLIEADGEADFDAIAEAIDLARTRRPDLDLAFAVNQLVDVGTFALEARADSSTAHEMLVHLEVVLAEIVDRGLPRLHDEDQNSRRIYDRAGWDAVDLVQLCVERLREPAVRDPETTRHLLQMLRRVGEVAKNREATAVVDEIEKQVEKVLSLAKKDRMLSRNCE